MPAFNPGRFLLPAIESVLGQSWQDLELIVVNDGSTDGSTEILSAVRDRRLRVINQENAGESAARNTGLQHCQGEYIMWNDADDISLPHRAATLVDALEGSAASFAHSDMLLVDADGAPLGYWQAAPVPPARMLQFLLRVGTPFNNASMLVRAEVFSGLSFNRSLLIGTDTDMVRQFAPEKPGVYVPEPLLLYRRWAGTATNGGSSAQETDQVEVLLGAHSPEELVPEAKTGRDQECWRPVALALVALALVRRGLVDSGARRLQAAASGCPEAARPLVAAVAALCEGNLRSAETCLSLCGDGDAIAVNLRGEIHAQRGEWTAATAAFRDALAIDPSYYEPVLNLRGAGGARGMNLVDRTWARFVPRAA
jgi:hypothetical protein